MPADRRPVVTRFAPSPTGFLHIGGARTALFNWLFARRYGGEFLLRIEDTDKARSTQEAIDAILSSLDWLELSYDGDVVYQSSRSERHREVGQALLAAGHAYRCYATAEENAAAREKARAEGRSFLGDLWRERPASEAPADRPYAVRMKMPRSGHTTLSDAVQGAVTTANKTLDDLVLLRADGSPTYMLSVVVDDHDMAVSHVIRGDDHLGNSFKQAQIYQAMGWPLPVFAHIPLIHGPDGKKLSKRHGALGVQAYRDMGYLPAALSNYLLRLGWSHGDTETIDRQSAIALFTLEAINKGPARLDFDKLDSLNAHYMRALAADARQAALAPFLAAVLERSPTDDEWTRVLKGYDSFAERAKRLDELAQLIALLCDIRPLSLNAKAAKALTIETRVLLQGAAERLASIDTLKAADVHAALSALADAQDVGMGKIMQPLRAALTGGRASGDLGELIEILGRQETLNRLADQGIMVKEQSDSPVLSAAQENSYGE